MGGKIHDEARRVLGCRAPYARAAMAVSETKDVLVLTGSVQAPPALSHSGAVPRIGPWSYLQSVRSLANVAHSRRMGGAQMALHTFVPDFIQRLDGPLHFRFFVQPLMAVLLAVRDGIKDARAGRSAFAWTVLVNPAQRRYLIHDGWKAISKVFILACVLDVIYELIVWRSLRPVQMVLVGALLSVIPYALLRGPVNRLMHLFSARHTPRGSPTTSR